MTVLLGCLTYVAATTLLAPVALTRGTWQVWYPRAALALWHGSLASSSAVVLYSVIYALGTAQAHSNEPGADTAHVLALTIGLWVGMFVVAALIALFLAHSEPVVRSDYANREKLQRALLLSPHHSEVRGDLTIRHIDHDSIFACAFRAPEPTVVLSRGLTDSLTGAEVDAVIEHERAHLTQHHHFALLLALVNEACLPGFEPARRLHQCTKLLVELIADDEAIKRCGRLATASALAKMAQHNGDPGVAARAARAGIAASSHRGRPSLIKDPGPHAA